MANLLVNLWRSHRTGMLLSLLEEDRKALLAGDYAALPKRARQLSALVAEIEDIATDPPEEMLPILNRIKAAATRNARLIKAAHTGLASAQDRIRAITDASPLRTYTDRGTQVAVSSPIGASDRRV